jgi:hypothetical protein
LGLREQVATADNGFAPVDSYSIEKATKSPLLSNEHPIFRGGIRNHDAEGRKRAMIDPQKHLTQLACLEALQNQQENLVETIGSCGNNELNAGG